MYYVNVHRFFAWLDYLFVCFRGEIKIHMMRSILPTSRMHKKVGIPKGIGLNSRPEVHRGGWSRVRSTGLLINPRIIRGIKDNKAITNLYYLKITDTDLRTPSLNWVIIGQQKELHRFILRAICFETFDCCARHYWLLRQMPRYMWGIASG